MKRCTKCGELKSLDDFYRAAGMRDGHRNDCKACNLRAKHERYIAHPSPTIERVRRWRSDNKARADAWASAYRLSGKKALSDRKSYLKRTYGLTIEQYDAMLLSQKGGCAICGRPPSAKISLHVDHHHVTGVVRGLLCFPCNNAIGLLQEDPVLFQRAADYLRAA